MWKSFVKTIFNGSEQNVAVFHVLPRVIYTKHANEIHTWTQDMNSGPFNVDAAYNIVPVAFSNAAKMYYKIPYVGVDPKTQVIDMYAEAYDKLLKELCQSKDSNLQKGTHFAALHSYFRGSLDHFREPGGMEIQKFMKRADLDFYFSSNKKAVQDFEKSLVIH